MSISVSFVTIIAKLWNFFLRMKNEMRASINQSIIYFRRKSTRNKLDNISIVKTKEVYKNTRVYQLHVSVITRANIVSSILFTSSCLVFQFAPPCVPTPTSSFSAAYIWPLCTGQYRPPCYTQELLIYHPNLIYSCNNTFASFAKFRALWQHKKLIHSAARMRSAAVINFLCTA